MTQEYIQKYFKEDFEKDNRELNQDLICKMAITTFFYENEKLKNYIDAVLFVIFLYELNLISQLVHSHFYSSYSELMEILPKFPDTNCFHHGITPMEIIPEIKNIATAQNINLDITNDKILEVDIFFKDYLIKLFRENPSLKLSWEQIENALKTDSDIKRYLKKTI
jgi:hypothetical protein